MRTIPTIMLLALTSLARADEPAPRAIVVHVAPAAAQAGEPFELEAMIDAPFAEQLSVRWRPIGAGRWQDARFERSSAGGWFASLPAPAAPGVEYYIRGAAPCHRTVGAALCGADGQGAEVEHFASARAPHTVRVNTSVLDRLEAVDRARLGGRLDEVALDVTAHDFGNRYDLADWFVRGELVYTHHLLRTLHQVGFGFGSITGRTPTDRMPAEMGGDDVLRAMRYGFGQVRMRVQPSVFVDGRIGLGVSQDDFEGLGRASITFGKPWRSHVQLGGEYFGDLGPSGWVRLQWDTAWPLLMGASVVRTDLPGAHVDPAGLYIAYDVAYRLVDRFTVRAQLSYGARDGAAHAGGGLGTAVAF